MKYLLMILPPNQETWTSFTPAEHAARGMADQDAFNTRFFGNR